VHDITTISPSHFFVNPTGPIHLDAGVIECFMTLFVVFQLFAQISRGAENCICADRSRSTTGQERFHRIQQLGELKKGFIELEE
jgi:hypothetical protein